MVDGQGASGLGSCELGFRHLAVMQKQLSDFGVSCQSISYSNPKHEPGTPKHNLKI